MSAEDEDLDLETDSEPIVRLLVPAAGQQLPDTTGWPSVFDFAASMLLNDAPRKRRCAANDEPVSIQNAVHRQIERSAGLVVHRRIHYLDTAEWHEREAARRARQVLPRPPKQTFRIRRST